MKTALILSLLLSLAALADQVQEERFDKLAIGARSYTNAVLRIIDASTAVIHHEGSPEKIKLQDLPEPLRSKYYDPQKIQTDAQARAKLKAQKEAAQAAALRQAIEDYKKLNFRVVAGRAEDIKDWTSLDGKIWAVRPEGLILQLYTERQVYHRSAPLSSDLTSIGAYAPASEGYYTKVRELGDQFVFLACDTKNRADGEDLVIKAKLVGTKELGSSTYRAYDRGTPYP